MLIVCPACGATVAVNNGVEQTHNGACYMDGSVMSSQEGRMDKVVFYQRSGTDNGWDWHRVNAYSGDVVSTSGGQGYENYNDAYDQAYKQFGDDVIYENAEDSDE